MNKHGLNRAIPSGIKREVRQRCGFGCVVCGLGIVQYEHVEPEFSDAVKHEADKIVLLCPQCHSKVTTGF
jgi:5-methylcytosine-specific restriction endonuclease McrA